MAANDLPPGMPSLSDMQQLMASLAQMQYMMLRQSQAQGASRSLDEQQPPLETAPKAEEGAPESQLAQADEDNDNGEAAEADAAEGHVEDNMEEVKVDPAPEKASHPVKKAEYENETTDQRVKTIYKRVWMVIPSTRMPNWRFWRESTKGRRRRRTTMVMVWALFRGDLEAHAQGAPGEDYCAGAGGSTAQAEAGACTKEHVRILSS